MTAGTEADWKLLSDLLAERFGLSFTGARQPILAARLQARFEALHLEDARAYYHFLRFHPEQATEYEALSRQLTNNETYFFREPAQLDAIADTVVPQLAAARPGLPIRILSAGCSSGEEPYSLAVKLTDKGYELQGVHWEIEGCDLNPARLAAAREASYEGLALRACNETVVQHCFHPVGPRHQLKERYRKHVRFFPANLAAPFALAGKGPYDVILCRNLLIYFEPAAFDRVISRFAALLPPGGFLFLGHSESLFERSQAFEAVHFPGTVGYRRVEES
jgi:chemotaxis protein methyltransferase CheR